MFVIAGRVDTLLPNGFRLTDPGGRRIVIRTLGGGPELGLAIGGQVEVCGGPSSTEEGVFLCSTIFVVERNGDRRRLQGN